MRSFTFCTLIFVLSACGDKSDETTTETATTTATATATTTGTTTGTDTGTGTTVSEPGTTADLPTTGGAQSSGEATATTGPGETGSTSTGTTTTGSTSTGDTSTGETTTADSTGDSSSTSTGGGTSELTIAIVDAELWADCQPEVEPDPVQGSWFVEFDNSAGAAATSAKIIKASLSLLDADPPVIEEIAVSPTDSGPIGAGEQTSVEVQKLKGAAHSGCGHCGAFYLLALDYQEGDVIHKVTEEVTISCAF